MTEFGPAGRYSGWVRLPEVFRREVTASTSLVFKEQATALTLIYVALASFFAVFGYVNFSFLAVLATVALFVAVPLGLVLSSPKTAGGKRSIDTLRTWIIGFFGALVLLVSQLWGMWKAGTYFANFPNHRMDVANPGFHPDSALHVAIIQGILNTGYPTTGQHLEPFVRYHALSHYIDALLLIVLGLDPWESYSLFFFAKGVALTLALIFFAKKVAEPHSNRVFWAVLIVVYPAFTATWHVISSHGQWFPMLLLILSAHIVSRIVLKKQRGWRDYFFLSLLVVTMSFGKISIGLSFALIVGFSLFVANPRDWKLVSTGALWAVFFVFASSAFSTRISTSPDESVWARFHYSWPNISSVLLILFLGVTLLFFVSYPGLRSFVIGGFLSFLLIFGFVAVAVPDSSDSFYFFHGFFSMALLFAMSFFVGAGGLLGIIAPAANASSPIRPFVAALFLVSILVSPVSTQVVASKFYGSPTPRVVLASINEQTYYWFNVASGKDGYYSFWDAVRGVPLPQAQILEEPLVSRLTRNLNSHIAHDSLQHSSPVLFMTAEQLDDLGDRISSRSPWTTSFALTAVSGLPLIYGVYDPALSYGWHEYTEESARLSEAEVSEELLCEFNRPVVILHSLDALNFETLCLGQVGSIDD